jgi:hypothetical protein
MAEQAGDVLAPQARLVEGPGGEHVTQRMERPGPPAVGSAGPADRGGCRVPHVAPVVGPPRQAAVGRRDDDGVAVELAEAFVDETGEVDAAA